MTVRVDNPARFLKDDGERIFKLVNEASWNQLYFGVENARGTVVYAIEYTGHGGNFSFRPDLESCGPVGVVGRLSIAPPPPCPA